MRDSKVKGLKELRYSALLRGDPLLTDVDNEESCIDCVLCEDSGSIGSDAVEKLYWFEYHPSVHATDSNKICDHCLFPPPRNIDFIMCSREKHLFCLYCIELKLFRIQLGRFVMEQDDDSKLDLGIQWERDYIAYRQTAVYDKSRRNRSATNPMKQNGLCCFKQKEDYWAEEKQQPVGTLRIAGYKTAMATNSMITIEMQHHKKNKKNKKKKQKKKSKDDDEDSKDDDSKEEEMQPIVDENDIDELYEEEFKVDTNEKVVLEQNKKKIKAVTILLDACQKGGRQPPSVIIELNYDKYAVYCFTFVMGKLELKQRPFLFHTLEFIAMVAPTTVMLQLIMQYKKQFLMLPYRRIDSILLAVIRGSKYSIATALKMAGLAGEFAAIDLSAKEVFLRVKEKYVGIAIELLKQIESHHLAAVLLETPSDIEYMTPLDLAFQYKLFSFLSQSKIEKIAHQVMVDQFFLNPVRTFEVSDIDSWDVLEFLKNPYKFYFQPFGKKLIQTSLFIAYLFMFSYILIQRPGIYDVPEAVEIIFWVFNIGYFGFELYQAFIEDGLKEYLTDWTNYIDMGISVNFATQIILRVIWIFGTSVSGQCDNNKIFRVQYDYNSGLPLAAYQRCPTTPQISSTSGYWPAACAQTFADWPLPDNDTSYLCAFNASEAFYYSADFKCDCWKQLDYYLSDSCCRKADSTEAVLFNFLYGFNAILMWIRTLYFAEQDSTLGPLIKIIMAMKDDFINYLKLTLLFMVGFSFAIRAFIGDYSYEFDKVQSTILYMFKSTFGKIDFSVLEACGDFPDDLCKDSGWVPEWRSNLVQLLIMGYLIIALIMIRLLIAMISFTYNKMIRQAEHQVVYQYIKNAYDLDRSSGLMPPPLNIFVFGITVIWLIMDVLMVILINRYIDVENHLQLAKPVGTSYVKRVWHGIQDLFSRNTRYWICAHCKEHNYEPYNISSYLSQFKPACDPQDAKIVEVYAPEICQQCYRNKSEVGRMTIVLQQISFLVFCVAVWPCLIILVLIPASISWFADFLSDGDAEEQWGDGLEDDDDTKRKQQLKRHHTMGGAAPLKKDRKSPEYKARKKREKELKKKKELIRQAERYRMYRQLQQLDTQLNAIPSTESHASFNALRKSLRQIIKSYNPRSVKHILTPNINEIVDEVTSDKTPVAKLQVQVRGLQSTVDELLALVKANSKFTLVKALTAVDSDDGAYDGDDKNGSDGDSDNFMMSVTKAAEQIQSAVLKNKLPRKLPRTQLSNRLSNRLSNKLGKKSMHEQRQSIQDIASALFIPMVEENSTNSGENVSNVSKHSVTYKPTDVMRHKSAYKLKSKMNVLQFAGNSDSDSAEQIVSNVTSDVGMDIVEESVEKEEEKQQVAHPKTKKGNKRKSPVVKFQDVRSGDSAILEDFYEGLLDDIDDVDGAQRK